MTIPSSLILKYSWKYAKASNDEINVELEALHARYSISDDDWVKLMICLELLGVREYQRRTKK